MPLSIQNNVNNPNKQKLRQCNSFNLKCLRDACIKDIEVTNNRK